PVGYDLVSLLKDCYISWSRERVERWVKGYRRVLGNLGANVGDSEYQFIRWFDVVGVQRHIKVLGIFCRLWYRDGKPGYLGDLPLVFEYVRDACRRYPELVEFERWLAVRVAPLFEAANAREMARALALPKTKSRTRTRTKSKSKSKSKTKTRTRPQAKRRPSKAARSGAKARNKPLRKTRAARKPAPKRRTTPKRTATPKRRAPPRRKIVTRRRARKRAGRVRRKPR